MTLLEMRKRLGATQQAFAARYGIPLRTIQNWELGLKTPPEYLMNMLEARVSADLINRRTVTIPEYDPKKITLPDSREYLSSLDWLRAVREHIGPKAVFALDTALMCQQTFLGRHGEYIVWIYGDDSLSRFNGVTILGNNIDPSYVEENNGLQYTNFNRTVVDALANEPILDMQGITEALSRYYYTHGESFDGIFIPPEYQEDFSCLAQDAIEYYDS